MDTMLPWFGSGLLAVGAIAIGVVVHAIGLGRIAPTPLLGLPGKRLRADASSYRSAHRAATPLTWLTASVAAVSALGALVAGRAGMEEWAVLTVLAAVVLVVGLALATWRAHSSL